VALTKIDDRGLKYPLEFQDNEQLRIGTNSKTQLYHTGSQFYLNNNNGNIYFRLNNSSNAILVRGSDGSVELYHNGGKKLETYTNGVQLSGNLYIPDSDGSGNYVGLGDAADFKIYHDGSYSRINSTSHGIIVRTDMFHVNNAANNEALLKATNGGAVELYYDNNRQLLTAQHGIVLDHCNLFIRDNKYAAFGTGDDFKIYHDGSNSYLNNTAGYTVLNSSTGVFIKTNNEHAIDAFQDGAVKLYYNNDNKFETHDVGCIITQSSSSVANGALKINTTLDNYGSIIVRDQSHSHSSIGALEIENNGTGTDETNFVIRSVNNGSTSWAHAWYAALSHKFAIQSNSNATPKVQIDTHGIKFNGDTAAANALDDFEEGSFTPNLQVGGSDSGITYSYAVGQYVKIGRQVHVNIYISLSNKGSNTGNIHFGNLPFAVTDTLNGTQHEASGSVGYISGLGTNATFFTVTAVPSPSALMLTLLASAASVTQHATQAHLTNNFGVRCSCTYFTSS